MCRKSCVDNIVKILLYGGGDVALCARTSKHIFVFVFDPLSLNYLSLYLALIHIVRIIYMLGIVCVCPYLC